MRRSELVAAFPDSEACITFITAPTPVFTDIAVNLFNAKLNPICHFLALLGAHHIFHVSGVRVKIDCMLHSEDELQIYLYMLMKHASLQF